MASLRAVRRKSPGGERLGAWITKEYGLNLKEIITGADGKPKQEWRLVEIVRGEPDPALFMPPQ